MTLRESVLEMVSRMLADVCDQPDAAHNWRHEADVLLSSWVGRVGKFTFEEAALVPMLDWWQDERIAKNSDFPLGGMSWMS